MLHALPRRSLRERAGRPLLPVLLITAATGAFGGLAVAAPGPAPAPQPDVLAFRDTAPVPVLLRAELDRASRSKPRPPLPSVKPSPAVKPAPAAVKPPPKPKVAPKPRVKASPRAAARTSARVFGGTCPVPNATFTDTWGAPRSGGRSHKGTDLLAPLGSPVYAVASGVVDTTSSSNGGISLYLRAANGDRYFYAHNSANVARDGQRVQAGELIARVGSTGNAGSTNHVHFEREVDGVEVNPYRFLKALCG